MKNWDQSSPAKYFGTGIQLAVSILLGFAIGYFLDKKFSSLPWFTLSGCFLGFLAGFLNFFNTIRNNKNETNSK